MLEAMLEGGQVWSLISIFAGVFAFLLGVYVYRKNPFMESSIFFFRLMLVSLFLGIFDFLLMNSPDEATARLMARIIFFLVVILFSGYLYIALSLPHSSSFIVEKHGRKYWLVVILIGLIPALMVNEMLRTRFGWGVPNSLSIYILGIIILGLLMITIFFLVRVIRRSDDEDLIWQAGLMAVAVIVPMIYGFGTEILDDLGLINSIPILSPGFVISNIVFAIAVIKFNMFIISPVKEEGLESVTKDQKGDLEVPAQCCVLVEEKRAELAFSLFLEELGDGSHGLVVTRTHPDAIRERYGLAKTPIIWLANRAGVNHVDPGNLSILQHTITEFTRKTDRAVIMLEGLEYLMANNPMDKLLKLIYALRDEAVDGEVKVLIPVDPVTLDLKDLALLERECEVIDSRGNGNEKGKGRDRDLNSSQGIHSPTG